MAGDLLDRILGEIRARKREARAAYEETLQLEQALAALNEKARGASSPRSKGSGSKRRRAQPIGQPARRGDRLARTTVASTVTRLAASGVLERSELPDGRVGFRAE